MLDDDHAVARIHQAVQHTDELVHIGHVQAHRGFVQHIERVRRLVAAPGHVVAHLGQLGDRSEEHTSELQSPCNLVCRLLLEKKKRTVMLLTIPPLRSAMDQNATVPGPRQTTNNPVHLSTRNSRLYDLPSLS